MELNYSLATFLNSDIDTADLYIEILSDNFLNGVDFSKQNGFLHSIKFLKDNHLIIEWLTLDKPVYMATPPEQALSAILLREAWRTDSTLHSISDIYALRKTEPLVHKLELLDSIVPSLMDMYTRHLPSDSVIVYEVQGKDSISANLAAQISSASASIKAVISPPHLMGEVVWSAIRERMDSGVQYKRVTVIDEIVRHGFAISKKESTETQEELFITYDNFLHEKYYIIDDEKVAIFVPGKTPGKFKAVHFISNEGVAKNYSERFVDACQSAVPFVRIIPKLEMLRAQLLTNWRTKYTIDEINWLVDLFDYGVFYTKSSYDSMFIEDTTKKMLSEGVIKTLQDGNVVINCCLNLDV